MIILIYLNNITFFFKFYGKMKERMYFNKKSKKLLIKMNQKKKNIQNNIFLKILKIGKMSQNKNQ